MAFDVGLTGEGYWDGKRTLTLTDLVRYVASERIPWDTVVGLQCSHVDPSNGLLEEAGAVILVSGRLTVVSLVNPAPQLHMRRNRGSMEASS